MTLPDLLTLESGPNKLRVCPHLGAALADWTHDGTPVLRPLAEGALAQRNARLLGCFPLVPYSNRIAWGRFEWEGRRYQLDHNFGDHPHTIHGVGWQQPWLVAEESAAAIRLVLDYDPDTAGLYTWPYRLHAEILYTLDETGLAVTLSARNDASVPVPVGLGLHPYLPRTDDVRIGLAARCVWTTDADALPDACRPLPPAWNFDPPHGIEGDPLDNCYAGWRHEARIEWPSRRLLLTMRADELFGHAVVYTPPGRPYFAVEPASNMTDAINRMAAVPDHGLRIVAPGDTVSGQVRFAVGRG